MKYPGTSEADFESFSQFLSPPLRLPSMGLKVNKQAPIIKVPEDPTSSYMVGLMF
jgi:hypothetical protein